MTYESSAPGSRMEKKSINPMKNFWGSKLITPPCPGPANNSREAGPIASREDSRTAIAVPKRSANSNRGRFKVDAIAAAGRADVATLNGKIMLAGYSEGGHASMAGQRDIDTYNNSTSKLINVVAAAHMAGPYDVAGALRSAPPFRYQYSRRSSSPPARRRIRRSTSTAT